MLVLRANVQISTHRLDTQRLDVGCPKIRTMLSSRREVSCPCCNPYDWLPTSDELPCSDDTPVDNEEFYPFLLFCWNSFGRIALIGFGVDMGITTPVG